MLTNLSLHAALTFKFDCRLSYYTDLTHLWETLFVNMVHHDDLVVEGYGRASRAKRLKRGVKKTG